MTGVIRIGPGAASRAMTLGGEDRRVVLARHRAVAPRPMDVDPVRGEALLGDLDRVEPRAAHVDDDAAGLVDRRRRAQPVPGGRREPARAARPPASSSAVDVNRMSRRRPGIGSRAGIAGPPRAPRPRAAA